VIKNKNKKENTMKTLTIFAVITATFILGCIPSYPINGNPNDGGREVTISGTIRDCNGNGISNVEIFDWPGIGSLMLEGLGNRDYPIVQGCVLIFSFGYLIVNLLTDLISAALDPRIKLGKS